MEKKLVDCYGGKSDVGMIGNDVGRITNALMLNKNYLNENGLDYDSIIDKNGSVCIYLIGESISDDIIEKVRKIIGNS